jgi:integrase
VYAMKGIIRQRGNSFQVRYWDKETKSEISESFDSYGDAEMFLAHLNVSRHEGKLDARDYRRDNPMGFQVQAENYLEKRKGKVKDFRHIETHIKRAIAYFGGKNIKEIGFAELDDYQSSLKGKGKTIHNYMTSLHTFFEWFHKREKSRGYMMPDFPVIDFELGWRKIVDKPTQGAIIEEVKRISFHINPRIWFGISLLANFPKVRPEELRMVNEGDIDRKTGEVWIRHTKEGREKRIYLLEEDLAFIRLQPESFGKMPFFRHMSRRKGIHRKYVADSQGRFGEKYLYKWWVQACSNLGVDGVDLYGGTKHSTVTAARKIMTPEEIRRYVTEHQTNVAFDRYLQVDADAQREASAKIRSVQVLTKQIGQHGPGNLPKSEG